jgi:hypothetical protein
MFCMKCKTGNTIFKHQGNMKPDLQTCYLFKNNKIRSIIKLIKLAQKVSLSGRFRGAFT